MNVTHSVSTIGCCAQVRCSLSSHCVVIKINSALFDGNSPSTHDTFDLALLLRFTGKHM